MSWSFNTALSLGRVSNLPTVWTNTVAGAVLAGVNPADWRLLPLLLAMTLAYTGGMFLNDAFDAAIDAAERPERPIPSGTVSVASVFAGGYMQLILAIVLVALITLDDGGGGLTGLFCGISLAGAIVLYNAWHKNNPLSPLLMGLCRMLVYITAAFSLTGSPSAMVFTGALVLLAYLIGLTYTAKQENLGRITNLWPLLLLAAPIVYGIACQRTAFTTPNVDEDSLLWPLIVFTLWLGFSLRYLYRRQPGDIPRAVGSMIAGISLIDAMFLASAGYPILALCAVACCLLAVLLQRWVAGT
ncbi:MAG: UbiA family prenyltransferase [Granulosicoccus sp.]|nr:UbiA family prenyltransferase [Granulosicoccus sp.]